MKIIQSPRELQQEMGRLRSRGKGIGFVPTMGALHEGHLSLIRKARSENRVVVVSIFVNPLQFGPKDDFKRYPRRIQKDRAMLAKEKVDYLFMPSRSSFYPEGYQTLIEVKDLSRGLCGKFRPGHFQGVATVVAKLFNVTKPHRAYFGAKDYQQALIIKQMASDLNFGVEIRVLPLIRDKKGLALSSRNAYLSFKEKERALAISRSLNWAKKAIRKGNRNVVSIRNGILKSLKSKLRKIDYIEIVEAKSLQPVKSIRGQIVIAVAGWVGETRLIDNVIIRA
ncbi:MAG: pantoate--beta-alanine ligase [Candidatus Omnitrophica bacterium]|nr:pantoate--beta-alanine ligase [Candidatus Omnitrophota bacterium]